MFNLTATINLGIFIVGVIVGLVIGYRWAHAKYVQNRALQTGEIFAILLSFAWLGAHTYAMYQGGIEIGKVFDIIGGVTVGNVVGLNLETVKSLVMTKK